MFLFSLQKDISTNHNTCLLHALYAWFMFESAKSRGWCTNVGGAPSWVRGSNFFGHRPKVFRRQQNFFWRGSKFLRCKSTFFWRASDYFWRDLKFFWRGFNIFWRGSDCMKSKFDTGRIFYSCLESRVKVERL